MQMRGATHIPREDDEHGTDWQLADKALETLLGLAIRVLENLIADLEQVFASLNGSLDLDGAEGDGSAHLNGDLLGKLILAVKQTLEKLAHDVLTLLE